MSKLRKKFAKLVLTLALVIVMAVPTYAAEYANTTKSTSFRTGAGSSYRVIQTLPKSTKVQILSRSGSWSKIKYKTKTGYVYSSALKSIIIKKGVVKVGSSGLTIRSKASTSGKSIGKLYAGANVNIVDETTNWYKIDYNRKTAYVSKKYVVLTDKCSDTIETTAKLSVRKDPSTVYKKIGSISKGQILTVKGKCANGWYIIDYGSKTGYISSKYKNILEPGTIDKEVIGSAVSTYKSSSLSIRSGEGTDYTLLDKIPPGVKVEVLKEESGSKASWTKVRYKNLTGYASTKYLNIDFFNKKPVISANTVNIELGESYDNSMLNAKAKDEEDGDLTSSIVYSGEVNTSKVGSYTIKLYVVDSFGHEVTKSVKVNVNALPPTITAVDEIGLHVRGKLSDDLFEASAVDCEGNPLTINIDKSGVDMYKAGTYTAVVSATDKWGNTVSKDVRIFLINDIPVVMAKDISVNAGSKYTHSMIGGTANDTEDGSLTDKIKYSGEVNVNKVGTYKVKVMATDSGGETGYKIVNVTVKPVPPTIKSVASLDITSLTKLTDSLFKASAVDCEGNSIEVSIDKTKVDMTKSGTYTAVVSATDKWNNTVSKKVSVKVTVIYKANSEGFRKIVRDEMYRLVNDHRKNNGVNDLVVNEDIQNTAYVKSKHMADNDYFDHRYNGKMVWEHEDVAKAHGENIVLCYTYPSYNEGFTEDDGLEVAAYLFDLWKNSPGHNANMLYESFKYMGFDFYLEADSYGYYAVYGTQEFKYSYDF